MYLPVQTIVYLTKKLGYYIFNDLFFDKTKVIGKNN